MTARTPSGPSPRFLYRQAGPVRLYLGDATTVLASLPPSCVDCVVTSPPYWGHRDYATGGWAGGDPGCPHLPGRSAPGTACPSCAAVYTDPQLGLEATLDALAWLARHRHLAAGCAFATAPDVVGDAAATLARSEPMLPETLRPFVSGGEQGEHRHP